MVMSLRHHSTTKRERFWRGSRGQPPTQLPSIHNYLESAFSVCSVCLPMAHAVPPYTPPISRKLWQRPFRNYISFETRECCQLITIIFALMRLFKYVIFICVSFYSVYILYFIRKPRSKSTQSYTEKRSVKFNRKSFLFASIMYIFLPKYSQKGHIFC